MWVRAVEVVQAPMTFTVPEVLMLMGEAVLITLAVVFAIRVRSAKKAIE